MSRLYLCADTYNGRTVISDSFFTAPFKTAMPFYHNTCTEVMIMTASAGLLDGDECDIEIYVKSGAVLKVTGQSYTKIFRAGPKGGVKQNVKITVENGGTLFYLPQPVIPFSGSIFSNETNIFLKDKASFVMQDILSSGRNAMKESFLFSSYRSRTAVHIEKKLVFLDNLKLVPSEYDPSKTGYFEKHTHSGMLYSYNHTLSKEALQYSTKAVKGECLRLLSNNAQALTDIFVSFIQTIL